MRYFFTCLFMQLLWLATASADDLYLKVADAGQVEVGGEYALASQDKRGMLTFDGSKMGQMATGTSWIGSDDGIVIPFYERQQPALLGLIEAGDCYVLYFKGTETCLCATGSKNSPKLSTMGYSEDIVDDNRALWKMEVREGGIVLRSVQVDYCLVYSSNTFKVASKSGNNQYVNIFRSKGEGVRIPSSEYISYVTLADVDFSLTPDLTACEVVAATKSRVNIVPVGQAPAFTAVVLHAPKGCYAISKAGSTVDALTSNLLRASDGSMSHRADGANFYVLDNKLTHGVGFYRMDKDDIVAERTGYLIIRGDNRDAEFIPIVDGPPTAVEQRQAGKEASTAPAYDLQGIRQSSASTFRGLRIIDGRKVVSRQ